MNNYFIILAAGKGKRFNSKVPKPYYLYKGKPLIQHSIDKVKNYKKINNKIPLKIKSIWRFKSFNSIKLLSINVKNVINPIVSVIKNMSVINRFLFKKVNIN